MKMKKYKVVGDFVIRRVIYVDAENEGEAEDLVANKKDCLGIIGAEEVKENKLCDINLEKVNEC